MKRKITKEEFIKKYYSDDVPEWLEQFVSDLNYILQKEFEKGHKEGYKAGYQEGDVNRCMMY